jgi:[ribosomal protein S5]-alanine N-acetyltransferase
VRPLSLDDVPALAGQLTANRTFLAPFEPVRDDDYFTEAGQLAVVRTALKQHDNGVTAPYVIHDEGRLVGRITLSEIVRGPLQSCSLGYWVAESENGRGLATAAVRDILGIAFGTLRLHRVQAGTLLHNQRSQHVLERNDFARIGVAPKMLRIAGDWQDHVLFQVLAPSPT